MNTRTYYESLILKDLKEIPDESLPSFHSFVLNFKSLLNSKLQEGKSKLQSTGLCGSWQDSRTPEEIIRDIERGADYFSNRDLS